jgi:hypothetical protein
MPPIRHRVLHREKRQQQEQKKSRTRLSCHSCARTGDARVRACDGAGQHDAAVLLALHMRVDGVHSKVRSSQVHPHHAIPVRQAHVLQPCLHTCVFLLEEGGGGGKWLSSERRGRAPERRSLEFTSDPGAPRPLGPRLPRPNPRIIPRPNTHAHSREESTLRTSGMMPAFWTRMSTRP